MRLELNKKNLEKLSKAKAGEISKDTQKRLDKLFTKYASKPVDEVEKALVRELRGTPIDPDKKRSREWAEAISSGTRIKFKTG